jgi:type 1 fimbriae regulatory protein FimB/type 1 fimbriae regulatory protein FimE
MVRMKQSFHYLTQDEVKGLLYVAKRYSIRDYAILLLAYRHGLRASEIGALRKDDLDLEHHAIQITRLKGSYGGRHLMKPDEVKALRAYLRTRTDDSSILFLSKKKAPIERTALHRMMKAYGEEAQIPKKRCHFHALKHSIATHMLEANFEIMEVRDHLGHANIQNTTIYAQVTSKKREEFQRRMMRASRIV